MTDIITHNIPTRRQGIIEREVVFVPAYMKSHLKARHMSLGEFFKSLKECKNPNEIHELSYADLDDISELNYFIYRNLFKTKEIVVADSILYNVLKITEQHKAGRELHAVGYRKCESRNIDITTSNIVKFN